MLPLDTTPIRDAVAKALAVPTPPRPGIVSRIARWLRQAWCAHLGMSYDGLEPGAEGRIVRTRCPSCKKVEKSHQQSRRMGM